MVLYCLFQAIDSWLPASEHKLASMRPVSTNPDMLQDQIEELKVKVKGQGHIRSKFKYPKGLLRNDLLQPLASKTQVSVYEITVNKLR